MKSTHQAIVVPLVLEKHPNADSLSIVQIDPTTQVVVNTKSWEGQNRAVFVPIQNMIDTDRPEFSSFKKGDNKWLEVKPIKLRGVFSMGLLAQCHQEIPIGTDMTVQLGVVHVDHEANLDNHSEQEKAPSGLVLPKYDIDGAKYIIEHIRGHEVTVSAKMHGSNTSIYYDGQLHVRSRTVWQRKEETNPYWYGVLNSNVEKLITDRPNLIVQGETIGVQGGNYRYSLPPKVRSAFRAFDIRKVNGNYINHNEFLNLCNKYQIETVPQLMTGLFDDSMLQLCSGTDYGCTREGVVIKTTEYKTTPKFERMIFKVISPEFKG